MSNNTTQQPYMAERQPFTASTIINNPTINIMHQLNLPPNHHSSATTAQMPPAAFQPNPYLLSESSFAKLNPSAPTFTPNPCADPPNSNAVSLIEQAQQGIQASMAKLQLFSLQLHALNAMNSDQSQRCAASMEQYHHVYAAYQTQLTNAWLLQQYLDSLQKQLASKSAPAPAPVPVTTPPHVAAAAAAATAAVATIGGLVRIDEGEEEETLDSPHSCAAVNFEGSNRDVVESEKKYDETNDAAAAAAVAAMMDDGSLSTSMVVGEDARNFWKFMPADQDVSAAETLEEIGEKMAVAAAAAHHKKSAESEKIKHQIRGILNKIAPENFDKLSLEISSILKVADTMVDEADEVQLRVAQKAQFKALIRLILKCVVEKAVSEPRFHRQYARLCYSLYLYAYDACDMKKKVFRMQLIALCHSIFKKSREHADRARFIGIVSMIGELFEWGLISWNVIHSGIFGELLPPETALNVEAVCQLLKSQGRNFDKYHCNDIDGVMMALNQCAANYDFRTQCMVKDMAELRQNSWKREVSVQEAPKIVHEMPHAKQSYHAQPNSFYTPSPAPAPPERGGYAMQGDNHNENNRWRATYSSAYHGQPPRYPVGHRKRTKSLKPTVEFVKDVTLPDRSQYPSNQVLTKTWAMRNSGELPWGDDVELVYFKGDEQLTMARRYPVMNAMPGQLVEMSATVKTPNEPGRYCTYFRLMKSDKYFGPRVWVDIIVTGQN